jgi:predicted RNA-binding Zn ribbon-like protein
MELLEHRLVCCPLKSELVTSFKSGAVSPEVIQRLVHGIYEMYWDYFDVDSPLRRAVQAASEEARVLFLQEWVEPARKVRSLTLREFIRNGFKG